MTLQLCNKCTINACPLIHISGDSLGNFESLLSQGLTSNIGEIIRLEMF